MARAERTRCVERIWPIRVRYTDRATELGDISLPESVAKVLPVQDTVHDTESAL